MSAPSNSTRPASGAIVPVMMPNKVVLPAPFGPDDAERLAGRKRKIDPVGDHDGAEPLRDFVQRQDRGHEGHCGHGL